MVGVLEVVFRKMLMVRLMVAAFAPPFLFFSLSV
jgi:hypothetical protein